LAEKPEGKRPLRRPKWKLEGNIKMSLKWNRKGGFIWLKLVLASYDLIVLWLLLIALFSLCILWMWAMFQCICCLQLQGPLQTSRTVIVLTVSVKDDERGGLVHTSKSLLHQSAMWHCAVNTHCFYTVLFRLCVSFCLRWMAKSSNVSASSFAWNLANPLPKLLKCFMRLLENIL
jgi:hypothetical protein